MFGCRYAYALCMLQKLIPKHLPEDIKIIIDYDIVCNLKRHLGKLPQEKHGLPLSQIRYALPAWHAHGHTRPECQVSNIFIGCSIALLLFSTLLAVKLHDQWLTLFLYATYSLHNTHIEII